MLPNHYLRALVVVSSVVACAPPGQPPRPFAIDSATVRREVFAAMQQAADAAGTLDPVAALAGAPTDSSIIYVSDGNPIRGSEFVASLGQTNRNRDFLKIVVNHPEIRPLTSDIASATFWMTITSRTKAGSEATSYAIETAVFERKDGKWRPVLWHKTTLGTVPGPVAQAPPPVVRKIATIPGVNVDQAILMPNGRVMLYTASEGDSVVAYDLTTKRSTLVTHGWWPELAITRAGDRIAYGHPSDDGKLPSHIWTLPIDPATGTAVGPARQVVMGIGHTASFSPDGKFLAFEVHPPRADSSTPPSLLAVVSTAGGPVRIVGTYPQGVGAMGWSDDGQWLLAKTQGTVQRVPIGGGPNEAVLSYPSGTGGGMIISSGGQLALYYPYRGAKGVGRLGFATATGLHGDFPIPPGADVGTYVDNGSPQSLLVVFTRAPGVPTSTIFELDVTPILQFIKKP